MLTGSLSARRGGFLLSSGAGGCPAASNFSLLRQRKVTKRKATRSLGPSASLRATCGARLRRGLAKLAPFHCAQTTRSLIRLRLRSSAQPGRGNRDREREPIQTRARQGVSLWVSVLGVLSSAVRYFFSHPFWMRRGAEVQADQGSRCLSAVKRSEFSETPPGPSTAGCPERSVGTQQVGSPFFCLLFFGEAKKSELPPGNPRPAKFSKERSVGTTIAHGGSQQEKPC